jgi:hypothetical protein
MADGMNAPDCASVASLRMRVWDAGYHPVALLTNEKRPQGDAWPERARRDPPEAAVAAPRLDALNTGILCDGLRAVDIDVDDRQLAARIEAAAVAAFGLAPVRWRENSGRRLLVLRAAKGQPGKRILAGRLGKVEILGRGQQFHAYGRHPSGAMLRWRPESLDTVPAETLPEASEEAITAFFAVVAPLIGANAPKEERARDDGNKQQQEAHATAAEVRGVLSRIPNDGPADWEVYNSVGMAIYAALGGADEGRVLFSDWAQRNPAYDSAEVDGRWANYRRSPPSRTGMAALLRLARQAEPWPAPVMTILHRSATAAPTLPLDVFGTPWARWVRQTAEGANAPPDYVALPLLALASGLLGNARWVVGWPGWAEPPALWGGSVGNPSSGKSSGASPVVRDVLHKVEARMGKDYPAERARWEELAAVSAAASKQWEKDVAAAMKADEAIPAKPDIATPPRKPVRPRARVSDATIEKLGDLLSALPKGLLHTRDELAGWLLNLSRYSGGTDRPFWLEAYNGGPYQVDRQKNPEPIFVPHLTVPIFGTIQPDRLADVLKGADDGLASRFLWAWPEARPFAQPSGTGDPELGAGWLHRLADIPMGKDEEGTPLPLYVHLAKEARPVLAEFGREMQAREHGAHGLLKSSLGKARGQALRLALVLEYLWWCSDRYATAEPSEVSLAAMEAAAGLMDAYFLPMAARVLGDAAISEDERQARTLAGWIIGTRPERLNVSEIRDEARLQGLRESDPVKAACRFLAEAGWLRELPRSGTAGRPRGDWVVNPRLWEGTA